MHMPFNHGDMENIRNYSGKNDRYPNNIPKILADLGMEDERSTFASAVKLGAISTADEIMRLVTEYKAVRDRFGKNSLEIISTLYLKKETGSLNMPIGDSEKDELINMLEDKNIPPPDIDLLRKEEAARFDALSKELKGKLQESCMALFEQEFPDEPEYIRYIKGKDHTELFAELAEYTVKGSHNINSNLFMKYRNINVMPDDNLIGPIHTEFAKKIKHIFEQMKKDPVLRRIYNESRQ